MESQLVLDKAFKLWALLRLTERAMFKAREKELAQYGITVEQAAVCFYVQTIGSKATPSELSRWMLREPHTISGILDRMERKGMVRKIKDLGRNQTRVVLTKKGQEALSQFATEKDILNVIMSSLSKEEYQQLWALLEKLRTTALSLTGESELQDQAMTID